jgi:hypothetical protein
MAELSLPLSPDASPSGLSRWLQAFFGLFCLAMGGWILWDFPVAVRWLSVLGAVLVLLQWRFPRAWLLALPLLLPLLDLTPWSGRLLFNSWDGMLALVIGSALMAGQYTGCAKQIFRRTYLPLWLLLISTLLSLTIGILPLSALDVNAHGGYFTGWNALRVGKGLLWGVLLAPLLALQLISNRKATERGFVLGISLGLLAFGLVALWERGFFTAILTAQNVWGLAAYWLDLATTYRITGLFSQMHFGGEAVDGFLVLAWPFSLLLLLRSQKLWPMLLGGLALSLGSYAVMMTFTRATYAALGLAFIVFLVSALRGQKTLAPRAFGLFVSFLILVLLISLLGFHYGGVLVLLGYLFALLLSVALALSADRIDLKVRAALTFLSMLLGAWLAIRGMVNSKYTDVSFFHATLLVLPSVSALGSGGAWLGSRLRGVLTLRLSAIFVLGLAILLPAATLALSGARMGDRVNQVSGDLQIRWNHWRRGISLMDPGIQPVLLGNGLGTYPAISVLDTHQGYSGAYQFVRDGSAIYFRLVGTGDLRAGQRISPWSPGVYTAHIRARAVVGKPHLSIAIQPRALLEQERHLGGVDRSYSLKQDEQGFFDKEIEFNLTDLKAPPWHSRKSIQLSFANYGDRDSVLDIASISLRDSYGREILQNGSFAQGGDHWLAYNDYQHLAWHLKNLYVHLYFEQGVLGLVALLIAVVTIYGRLRRRIRQGDLFASALLAALSGFLLLGLTSTLFDVPRLVTLFILILVMGLWRERLPHLPKQSS